MGTLDLFVLVVYFVSMSFTGLYFARKANSTEGYFVGNRSYPGWLIGFSLFGTTISSITFVAYPADAYKTAYLRLLLCFTLPIGVWIASRYFLPFFRRGKITSAFQYLENRFSPATRVYAASVFIIGQCIRISLIQFLVAMLMHEITNWNVTVCILLGGLVTGFYTVMGGIEAVIWTDFIQSLIFTLGGILILSTIILKLPEGIRQIISIGIADGKFQFADLNVETGKLEAAPWGFSLSEKTVLMLLLVGFCQWLAEYSSNQEVIQKYCTSKTADDARTAMWICCWCSLPTWCYFMFLGTGLYVFFKIFPDPRAADMLSGVLKAEQILPYFVINYMPRGICGVVIAAVLAAAMSSMSSAMNSISAVAITDIYRRHLVKNKTDRHYVIVAKWVTLVSTVIMIGGAYILVRTNSKTLQHLATEFGSIIAGGVLGLYMMGFLTTKGDGRSVLVGIVAAVSFSAFISFAGLGWLPQSVCEFVNGHFERYYTGLIGNLLMFFLGVSVSFLFPQRPRNLTNLTIWTQDGSPLD